MDIEKKIRLMAGVLVIASSALAFYNNVYWLWLGIFVAVMLIQSAFTGFCPMECILNKVCKTKTADTQTVKEESVQEVIQTSASAEQTVAPVVSEKVKHSKKAKTTKHKKN